MIKELNLKLSKIFPYIRFNFILINSFKIKNLFQFKDKFPVDLHSNIIYKFQCTCCDAVYIGSTTRNFFQRIAEHKGISFRTGLHLSAPPFSAIRNHCNETHGSNPLNKEFSILSQSNSTNIRILESLYISQLKPSLNNMLSSFPLNIF